MLDRRYKGLAKKEMKFYYRAKNGLHDERAGEIEAVNERTAVSAIMRQGLTPVDVRPASSEKPADIQSRDRKPQGYFLGRLSSLQNALFQTDIVLFSRYLSDFLSAGVPVLKSLRLLQQYFPAGRMAEVLQKVEAGVRDGDALSDAMKLAGDVFSDMYVNMIRAGEIGGSLDQTVTRMADFLEQDRESRIKIVSSMVYPSMIVGVGAVTVGVLFTWILPKITVIFEDMDQTIPWVTRVLMEISAIFSQFWWLMGIGLIAASMVLLRWRATEDGRYQWDRWIFFLPWMGGRLREISVARFCRTLGTMLNGGVDIVSALNYADAVVENVYIRRKFQQLSEHVAGGMPLSQAMQQVGVFFETDVSMLSVGEESGALASGLFRLASFYEKHNDHMIKVITTVIEPAMILGLGLVIGFVVLAMLMPIFQMNIIGR